MAKRLPPLVPQELLDFHLLGLGQIVEAQRAVELGQVERRLALQEAVPPAVARLLQVQLKYCRGKSLSENIRQTFRSGEVL